MDRFSLSVVVDGDEEHDEWRDLVQCDRLWLISPIQTRKALPRSGHWLNFLGRCQEDYFRLAHLAFPLSELELFYSAQRGQCLC